MKRAFSFPLAGLILALGLSFGAPAYAQDGPLPAKPLFLETLAQQGAQIRYMGNDGGMDGWIAIMRGQEQFFYVTPDGQAAVSGVLIDAEGRNLSLKQVYELQKKNDAGALDFFSGTATEPEAQSAEQGDSFKAEFQTPAEQLFAQVENSNWIALGQPDAPIVYSFIDPQCAHCHDFLQDVRSKGYLDDGTIQVRIVPLGIRPETQSQAAFLLALPDPQERLFRYLDGDKEALPVTKGLNEQGAESNKAIMLAWKLNSTPLLVYRDRQNQVKIIEGRPNLGSLIKDLKTAP